MPCAQPPCHSQRTRVAARAGTSLASTYRVLALLVQLEIVVEAADGVAASERAGSEREAEAQSGATSGATSGTNMRSRRYALCSSAGHHHHFICRSCHSIRDVRSDALERALARVAAELGAASGLRIEGHELTLRGQCAECGKGE